MQNVFPFYELDNKVIIIAGLTIGIAGDCKLAKNIYLLPALRLLIHHPGFRGMPFCCTLSMLA